MMRMTTVATAAAICTVLSFSAAAQTGFTVDDYGHFLENIENLTGDNMLARHVPETTYFSDREDTFIEGYSYLDSVIIKYGLTDDERSLLEKNRFVVSERLNYDCFGRALHDIYGKDLPVFVTTDAVLQALHASYDRILMNLEQELLEPNLQEFLDALYETFPQLAETYGGNDGLITALGDVDLYITMAKSLLDGSKAAPHLVSGETVDTVWAAIESEQMVSMPLFCERNRNLDFSQFIVRGHYAKTPGKPLDLYFRCMMWLGRMDFMLTAPPTHPLEEQWSREDLQRMCLDAVLLNELIDLSGKRNLLNENDDIITFMIGESDNLTLDEFSSVLSRQGISSAEQVLDGETYDTLKEALVASPEYGQRILSNFFIMNPFSSEPDPLPVSYRLMGQRYIVDSYIFSNVVYDRIIYNGAKIWRPMPDPLDAMFVLGNGDALPLLRDELERYNYSSQLEALRYLVDAYDDDFWGVSLYNVWLDALRCLNPPSTDAGLPYFMKTTAWHQEKLNTQLASWAQLRHDTLLYAKQSYTGGSLCSYPHSYIEPYPAFYRRIADFADSANAFFSNYPSDNWYIRNVQMYFSNLKEHMERLETIALKEIEKRPFDDGEIEFLEKMLFIETGSGAPPFSGWYADLFYDRDTTNDVDYIVADVHTQPTDAGGNVVGNVLHVGVGKVNLGIFLADAPSNGFAPTAFVGPVMSYYEKVTGQFDRLTDERWAKMVETGDIPARPDWVNVYLADSAGNSLAGGRELPGILYTGTSVASGETVPNEFTVAHAYPNPFNPRTTISYTVSRTDRVTVTVYDILGRKVDVLFDGVQGAGRYDVVWNAGSRSSGVYFCCIDAGDSRGIVRMMLVR